jgi:hypothetical protein
MRILRGYGLVWNEAKTGENGRFSGNELFCSNIPNDKFREDLAQDQMLVDANCENEGKVNTNDKNPINTRKVGLSDLPYDPTFGSIDCRTTRPLNKLSSINKLSINNKHGGGGSSDQYQPPRSETMVAVDTWILEPEIIKGLHYKNGIPEGFIVEQELPFMAYWGPRGTLRHEWNSVFINRVIDQWKKKGDQWVKSKLSILDNLTF